MLCKNHHAVFWNGCSNWENGKTATGTNNGQCTTNEVRMQDNGNNQFSLSGLASTHRKQKNVLCSQDRSYAASQSSNISVMGKQGSPSLTIEGPDVSSSASLMLTHVPAAQRHYPPLLSVNELAVKKSVTLAPTGSGKFLWNIGRS